MEKIKEKARKGSRGAMQRNKRDSEEGMNVGPDEFIWRNDSFFVCVPFFALYLPL